MLLFNFKFSSLKFGKMEFSNFLIRFFYYFIFLFIYFFLCYFFFMKRSDSGTFKEEDLQIGKHGLLIHGESPRTPLRQGGKLLFNRNMNE